MKLELLTLVSSFVMASACYAGFALVVPQNSVGKVGQTLNATAVFQYRITNPTRGYANYTGFEKISVDGKEWRRPINFSLPPGGSKNVANEIGQLKYTANRAGQFKIEALIQILGNDNAIHRANAVMKVD